MACAVEDLAWPPAAVPGARKPEGEPRHAIVWMRWPLPIVALDIVSAFSSTDMDDERLRNPVEDAQDHRAALGRYSLTIVDARREQVQHRAILFNGSRPYSCRGFTKTAVVTDSIAVPRELPLVV